MTTEVFDFSVAYSAQTKGLGESVLPKDIAGRKMGSYTKVHTKDVPVQKQTRLTTRPPTLLQNI